MTTRCATVLGALAFFLAIPVAHSFVTTKTVGALRPVVSLWAKKVKVSDWAQSAADEGVEGALKMMTDQEEEAVFMTKAELKEQASALAAAKAEKSRVAVRPLELFVKAGPHGDDVGDCPFAHFVRMALAAKGVDYVTTPFAPDNKPHWLVEGYGGQMPALLHNGEAMVESLVIARYVEFFFPTPALPPPTPAAEAACAPLFSALAAFLKSREGNPEDADRRAALEGALAALDAHLDTCPVSEEGARYVGGGATLGLGDCSLAPQLFHLREAGQHFRAFEVPKSLSALSAYMDFILDHPAFAATACPAETVVWGWANARPN